MGVGKGNGRRLTPHLLLRAIPGTGGLKSKIAEKIGCERNTVHHALREKTGRAWDRVRQAYDDECQRIGDVAELTLQEVIQQRLDLAQASQNARWYLSKKHKDRGYEEEGKMTVQGGKTPVKITVTKELEVDKLPLELRRKILAEMEKAAEAEEKEEKEHDDEAG